MKPLILFAAGRQVATVIGRDRGIAGRNRVPSRPAVAHQVEGLELARQIIGLVEGGRTGRDQSDPFGPARDGRERHHRIDVNHRRFGFDIAGQHRKVRHEQELKLAPFRCLGVAHLAVEIRVVQGIDPGHAPCARLGTITVSEMHSDHHFTRHYRFHVCASAAYGPRVISFLPGIISIATEWLSTGTGPCSNARGNPRRDCSSYRQASPEPQRRKGLAALATGIFPRRRVHRESRWP
ncbi:hypothetical protein D3C71_1158800 [compost metagenome]